MAVLQPSPTAPKDTTWDTAYPLPADLVHLIWVRIAQNTGDPTANVTPMPAPYDILNGQLVINSQGGPPPPAPAVTPAQVTIKYVSQSFSDPTLATPTFVVALQHFVMAGVYRGLHEDTGEAKTMTSMAEMILQTARTRYDQQKPKRSFFNHRITAARRIRRPWPPVGTEWGGSGSPG